MAPSPTASSNDESENEELFSAVLSTLAKDQLPGLARSVRRRSEPCCLAVDATPTVDEPLFGSYHVLFPLSFADGSRWLGILASSALQPAVPCSFATTAPAVMISDLPEWSTTRPCWIVGSCTTIPATTQSTSRWVLQVTLRTFTWVCWTCMPRRQTKMPLLVALLRQFVRWLPSIPTTQQRPFVLAHPDFDIQNFLVSEDGTLQAILDWDGVAAVPRTLGALRYPGGLTHDWDPAMYGYKESMDRGEEPDGVWKDSPSCISHYRVAYEGIVERLLADRQSALSHHPCRAGSQVQESHPEEARG